MIEANVKVDWDASQMDEANLILMTNLERAIVFLHTQVLHALNVPNTGSRVKRVRGPLQGKGKRKTRGSYTVYANPSKPGEAPRKRTGFGQRNVRYSIDKKTGTGRVGVSVNAAYMAYLEVGTSKVAARPWLLATVKKFLPQIQAILFGG